MDGRVEVIFPSRRTVPSIAAPSAGKARLFEHTDVRVRAGALGARCAGKSDEHDVRSITVPA